ncbi:MAG TPA: YCF48-related protein [Flavipsychrobacter sp.]|nr:YCF48-related protein [Flavipsychrobacter sp.]
MLTAIFVRLNTIKFVSYNMICRIFIILLFISIPASGQKYSLEYKDIKTDASFRGLSVADEQAVWVSGSKGWVGRSADGGENWTFRKVAGYEQCDFRSLYAFDSNTAVIANAGSPAYVLRTEDGGRTWKELYKNTDSAAFIDGIDFWKEGGRKHGMIHGDPVKGRMLLLSTDDGGKTWTERRNSPELKEGEASFAASGTAIKCLKGKRVVVATGGMVSRLHFSRNRGKTWRVISTPMLSGSPSTGTYSFMTGHSDERWLIAGGDYKNDTVRTANFFYSTDEGKTWQAPAGTTRGYRECLAQKSAIKMIFAVGPSGIDFSTDNGVVWRALSDEKGFHVIKEGKGDVMFLAGANGKLAIMKVEL